VDPPERRRIGHGVFRLCHLAEANQVLRAVDAPRPSVRVGPGLSVANEHLQVFVKQGVEKKVVDDVPVAEVLVERGPERSSIR
jgi:hypothetical protein